MSWDRRKTLEIVKEYFDRERVWQRIVHLEEAVFNRENPGPSRVNIYEKKFIDLNERMKEVERRYSALENASQKEQACEIKISKLEDLLEEKERIIKEKERTIEEYKLQEEQNSQELENWGNKCIELDDLKDSLQEKEQLLSEKEGNLTRLRKALSEKEKELAGLDTILSGKETEITKLNSTLSEKESNLEEVKKDLSDKEDKLMGLRNELSNKEIELENVKKDLTDKVDELARVRYDLEVQEKQLQNTCQTFENTIGNYEEKFGDWDKVTSNYRELLQKIYSCDSMQELIKEAGLKRETSNIGSIDNVLRFIGYVGVNDDFVITVRNKMMAYKKVNRSFLNDNEKELIEAINQFYQKQMGEEEEKMFIPGIEKWDKKQMQDMDRASISFFSEVKGVYAPGIRKDGNVIQRAVIQGE